MCLCVLVSVRQRVCVSPVLASLSQRSVTRLSFCPRICALPSVSPQYPTLLVVRQKYVPELLFSNKRVKKYLLCLSLLECSCTAVSRHRGQFQMGCNVIVEVVMVVIVESHFQIGLLQLHLQTTITITFYHDCNCKTLVLQRRLSIQVFYNYNYHECSPIFYPGPDLGRTFTILICGAFTACFA